MSQRVGPHHGEGEGGRRTAHPTGIPLLQPVHRATLLVVTDKPRELAEILYDIDRAECVLRHAPLGLTREDPLDAMKRLGELARELEAYERRVQEACAGKTGGKS